jgi:hypothetical protein
VAIANAATSVEYLTGHHNVALHGVTNPSFVGGRTAEREASMFEALGRLAPQERPPYLLLTRSGYQGSELLQALAPGAPVFATVSFGDDLLLFAARWDLLDAGGRPVLEPALTAVANLTLADSLDVCDPADEAAHGYRYHSRRGELLIAGSVAIGPAMAASGPLRLADAGRLVLGGESFRVRTRAGRELVLVVRTHSPVLARSLSAAGPVVTDVAVPEGTLVVAIGGRDVARLALRNEPGWNEHVVHLPAAAVAEGETTLELRGRYAAYHYWFYQ